LALDTGKPIKPDRSKINIDDEEEVKYWCRHLKITREELERVVEKMGNSAAAVRKELGLRPVEIE
jgi:hypothetical protein